MSSEDDDALADARTAQVAVPALHRMLLGEAVAAEQLHAVEADLQALVDGQLARERGLARERQTLLGARGTTQGDQADRVEFGGDAATMKATA